MHSLGQIKIWHITVRLSTQVERYYQLSSTPRLLCHIEDFSRAEHVGCNKFESTHFYGSYKITFFILFRIILNIFILKDNIIKYLPLYQIFTKLKS